MTLATFWDDEPPREFVLCYDKERKQWHHGEVRRYSDSMWFHATIADFGGHVVKSSVEHGGITVINFTLRCIGRGSVPVEFQPTDLNPEGWLSSFKVGHELFPEGLERARRFWERVEALESSAR